MTSTSRGVGLVGLMALVGIGAGWPAETSAQQALRHIRAHPAQSDDSKFHEQISDSDVSATLESQ